MSSGLVIRLKASLAILFWGASFIATKIALRDAHPATIILLRFVFGAAVLWLAIARWRMFRRIGARDLVYLAILGFIAVPLHQALQAIGLLYTTASSMGWIIALIPVFTAILAWLFLGEPMSARKAIGSILAFSGAVFVVTRGALSVDTLRLPSTLGDALAVASALNWAIFQVASKPILRRLEPTLAMAYVMLLGGVVILPFTIPQATSDVPHLVLDSWLAILFLGIFCSGLGYLIWYDALSKIDASQLSALSYIQPLITLLIAAMFLGETITPAIVLGGAVILVGVYLVNRSATRRTVGVSVASE
ncbi:MAG: DMT family transporter [Anaerolineae bacterium]|nr:DMT family transporter [Anaerolineae bacterium]